MYWEQQKNKTIEIHYTMDWESATKPTNQPTKKKKREKEQKTIRNGTIYKLPEQQDQIGQKPQKTLKANTTALNNEHQFEICKVQPILRRSHSNDFAREIETNFNREKTP